MEREKIEEAVKELINKYQMEYLNPEELLSKVDSSYWLMIPDSRNNPNWLDELTEAHVICRDMLGIPPKEYDYYTSPFYSDFGEKFALYVEKLCDGSI